MSLTQRLNFAIQRRLVTKLLRLPQPVMRRLAGSPIVVDGQILNLPLQMLLRLFSPPPNHLSSVAETRAEFDEQGAWLAQPPTPDVTKTDISIPLADASQLRLRLYRPINAQGKLPVLVFYHGGGFVGGSLVSHDTPCQHLAKQTQCAVIAVDYRLAPEHRFPTAADDSIAAFRYIAQHPERFSIDPTRMAVGGDSAGGNLAAVVAQQTKADAIAPIFQLLWVPWVDLSQERASHELFSTGYFLERSKLRWYIEHYFTETTQRQDPKASPIYGDTQGVCSAQVLVAGFDPLRDEGVAYAKKLEADGVTVTLKVYPSLPHPFINIAGHIDDAKVAFADAVEALKQAFAT